MTALLFDLDGTLSEGAPGITRSIAYALERLGRPAPAPESLHRFVGPPLWDTFAELLGTTHRPALDEAVALYRERYTTVGLYEATVYPGVTEGLSMLHGEGHDLWVVTSKPAAYASRVVEHLGLTAFFHRVHGCELDGTRADKTSLIAHVLDAEGLRDARPWMIGDRAQDVIGARANAIRSLGVLWGYGDRAELLAAGADHVVASMDELRTVVS